jgi:hypothetical protein
MTPMNLLRAALVVTLLLLTPAASAAQPPAPQEGFVPVDRLQEQDELPAAPLVAAAYAVAWGAVLVYVYSIRKRLGAVEREMADVAKRIEAAGRR